MEIKEYDIIISEEVAEFREYAIVYMQREVANKKLVLSNQLLNSIETSVLKVADQMYAEAEISFRGYGRLLDMKSVSYGKRPSPDGAMIAGLEKYVEEVGLNNFNYVPGYLRTSRRMPTTKIAINRIAWGLAMSRVRKGTIYRRGKGWFGTGRGKAIIRLQTALITRIREVLLKETAKNITSNSAA
jgi:hypothetical protein